MLVAKHVTPLLCAERAGANPGSVSVGLPQVGKEKEMLHCSTGLTVGLLRQVWLCTENLTAPAAVSQKLL